MTDLITSLTEWIDATERNARADYGPWAEWTAAGCAADRKLIDEILRYEAKIDGEWGCCHTAEQIRAGLCWETSVNAIPALQALAERYGVQP